MGASKQVVVELRRWRRVWREEGEERRGRGRQRPRCLNKGDGCHMHVQGVTAVRICLDGVKKCAKAWQQIGPAWMV